MVSEFSSTQYHLLHTVRWFHYKEKCKSKNGRIDCIKSLNIIVQEFQKKVEVYLQVIINA